MFRRLRNRHIVLLDLPAIALAAYGAFVVRFDWVFTEQRSEFFPYLIAALIVKPLVLLAFGIYARYWRYASIPDMVSLGLAISTSSVAMGIVVGLGRLAGVSRWFPRSVIFIDWLLALVLIGLIRLSIRAIADQTARSRAGSGTGIYPKPSKRVLIVGAGMAGSMVVQELRRNPHLGMAPVGYLDDDSGKIGKLIHGVPVVSDTSALGGVVRSQRIDEVVIAMPRAPGTAVRKVLEYCRLEGVASRIVPGVFELLDGNVSVNRLRKVEIADLLRRPQLVGRAEHVPYLTGRTVLITGAGGSIGSELSRQVAFSGPRRLVLLGHGENSIFAVHGALKEQYPHVRTHPVIADVRDYGRLLTLFGRFKPDVVFHAAAHKHVPLMEENPEEAFTNNVRGTQSVLRASEQHGVGRFVLISTDKAVAPTSAMGASKRLAEALVLDSGSRTGRPYVVVRFGNVLGSRGSVVPTLQMQIERGVPLTLTHPDMKRFFMTIPEAVHLVLQAGGMDAEGGLFVLNMGEQLKVLDLANDLIRLSGVDPATVPIRYTGVRPGEKFEESLWDPDATVAATSNPEVFRVRERELAAAVDIRSIVDDVIAAAERGDLEQLRRSLAKALPDYADDLAFATNSSAGDIGRGDLGGVLP